MRLSLRSPRTRLITCPENQETAAVNVALFGDFHLRSCSRWPEMAGCGQECLSQIEATPNECLMKTIVTQWYEGKPCCFCGRAIEKIAWHERPPAVRLADGTTKEWKEIAPQDLKKVFETAAPACWACHIVETFRREQPAKVIERVRLAVKTKTIPPSINVY